MILQFKKKKKTPVRLVIDTFFIFGTCGRAVELVLWLTPITVFCVCWWVRARTARESCSREQPSQWDYIVILKIFRSSSKTLSIVTGSRVPLGRGRWNGVWGLCRPLFYLYGGMVAALGSRQIHRLLLQQQHSSLTGHRRRSDLQQSGAQITAHRQTLASQQKQRRLVEPN